MEMKRLIKYTIFISLFSILLFMYLKEIESRKEQQNLIEASADELKTWKNKDGASLAKIQVLETRNQKTFLAFKSKDSTIQELQRLVEKNKKLMKGKKGSVSIVKTETVINDTSKSVISIDTITKSPTYTATLKNKWYKVKTVATKDSTNISISTKHNISLIVGSERQGLFKPRKSFAIVKDDNPYSNIKDMRVYQVVKGKKNFILGPYFGAGMTTTNGEVRTGWQIGIGITYNMFEF